MIAQNISTLQKNVTDICNRSGREVSEVRIIAVSKNFGVKDILSAAEGGLKDFGENKAQELTLKRQEIKQNLTWHYIGHLQRNKVRFAVEAADYIHSVDSLLLVTEINKKAAALNKVQNILLQVKTSDEESKSGIAEESILFDLAGYCKELENINLLGLMTIAPYTDNKEVIRNSFRYLAELKSKLNEQGIMNVVELSMGMTNDFEIAIEEGATMLRIGTAIFGERDYSKNGESE